MKMNNFESTNLICFKIKFTKILKITESLKVSCFLPILGQLHVICVFVKFTLSAWFTLKKKTKMTHFRKYFSTILRTSWRKTTFSWLFWPLTSSMGCWISMFKLGSKEKSMVMSVSFTTKTTLIMLSVLGQFKTLWTLQAHPLISLASFTGSGWSGKAQKTRFCSPRRMPLVWL